MFWFVYLLAVTDEETQRLRLAFKRASGVNGYMAQPMFVREVLGDCVPAKVSEVIFLLLDKRSQNYITFSFMDRSAI